VAEGKRIVIALGGNALQRQGEASAIAQQDVADATARCLVPLIAQGYELVIVHGNGPQVGNIVLHEEALNTDETPTLPLDSCVAMSQGMIGFWLQQALIDEFRNQGMPNTAATVVTQMLVDKDDPAFQNPSKPIGPFYPTEEAARAAAEARHFVVKEDAGRGWRRVVPSPKPKQVIETSAVETLLAGGITVITAGGGGVPVVMTEDKGLNGIEAVIDKDFSAAVVAEMIHADRLVILTAVDEVTINFGTPDETPLHEISAEQIGQYAADGQFAPGSMLPKVQAAIQFVRSSGKPASIGSLDRVVHVLSGMSGTTITP
jgi:carbamate kinase